jgi:hypothetical protein
VVITAAEAHVNGQTVLLRVVVGSREGWHWMELEQFLRDISLDKWNATEALVGMVLPAVRHENAN